MRNNEKGAGLKYIFGLAGKNKILLLISAVFSVCSGLCTFVPYLCIYQVMVYLFQGNIDMNQILHSGILAAAAIVFKFLFLVLALGFSHIGAFNTLYNIRCEISQKLAKINLGFFDTHSTGGIKKIIIEDIERIEKFLAHQIPDVIAAILVPFIMFFYMLHLNAAMAFCLLLPLILGFVLMAIAMKITSKYNETYHVLLEKLNSSTMEFINGMQIMKTFHVTAESFRQYSETVNDFHKFWKDITKVKGATYGIFVVLIESGPLFSLPVGGFFYLNGEITLPTYIFFMIISLVFLTNLKNLLNIGQVLNQISSGIDRIKQIMDIPVCENAVTVLPVSGQHDIEFKDVTFAYNTKTVLKDVNLKALAGGLTAFVGSSGAGKSTAAQLIPRFWDVVKGQVTIDGVNINEIENENLMELISFVFQDNFMLNDTLYENIAIGKEGAIEEEVYSAAKAAQIHDFIKALPNGYQTTVGEAGTKLSGGEKQRICIARAILKDAPIIIFDEATSFSDIENEYKIQQALNNLLIGKTTIMIAHRLNTIKNAKQIYVFDQGKIVEHGIHNELIKKNGKYAESWTIYMGEGRERK